MTASIFDLALYAGGIFVLFLTPGPVWMAIVARTLSGGIGSAWPLALGVVVGIFYGRSSQSWGKLGRNAIRRIFGHSEICRHPDLFALGISLIRNADQSISGDNRLTRPGQWAGFIAGVAIILSNPKAILFYMGVLPGFFDLSGVTTLDIIAICTISAIVPFLGNLGLSLMVDRVRHLLNSPSALRKVNIISGLLLIVVGIVIPLT